MPSKKLNIADILDGLERALEVVQKIAPVAQKFEVTANVATIAIAAAEIGSNLIRRAEEGRAVIAEKDAAKLREILASIQAENDKLAGRIANS